MSRHRGAKLYDRQSYGKRLGKLAKRFIKGSVKLAKPEIIDLFCGCGGFSLGAHLAGFKTALAIDIDPILSSAFAKNFPKTKLLNSDLSTAKLRGEISHKNVVGIIGGPPCQGFSVMGRRDKNDPRNMLVSHFFRHVMELKPAFFVMENVPGILSGDSNRTLQKALKLLGNSYEIVGLSCCRFRGRLLKLLPLSFQIQ